MSWSHIKIDLPKPPRKLTRLIIRTVDTQEVEHISKGDVIIYGQVVTGRKTTILPLRDFLHQSTFNSFQGGNEQKVPLDFTNSVLACVVHINFNKYPSITFAQEAHAVNITVTEWKGIIKKKGFKVDLFIEDKNMQ